MQYAKWIGNVMQGDFGISLKYKRPVLDVVSPLIGNTLMLGGIAYALVFMLAIALASSAPGSRTLSWIGSSAASVR